MKKSIISSILINVILLFGFIILYNKYTLLKKELNIHDNGHCINKEVKLKKKNLNKTDPIYIFNSHNFSCDGKGLAVDKYKHCSWEKLQFADSLLNEVVKSKLQMFDNYIKSDKEAVAKSGNDFFVKCLRINTEQKEEFVKSQQYWRESSLSNSKIISIGCDVGTGCSEIVNDEALKEVLNRIKKIQELGLGCN